MPPGLGLISFVQLLFIHCVMNTDVCALDMSVVHLLSYCTVKIMLVCLERMLSDNEITNNNEGDWEWFLWMNAKISCNYICSGDGFCGS